MKFKILAAALAMAASTQASALIMNPVGGQGEAFFTIWDPNTQNSYVQDTGVTFDTFLANLNNASYSLSYAIDNSLYNSAFAGSNVADLQWNVSVAEKLDLDYANYENYGFIGTNKNYFQLNNAATGLAVELHDQMATAQKGTKGVGGDTNGLDNFAYWGTVANGGYAGDCRLWCYNWGGSPVNNTASVGESMSFWYERQDIAAGPAFVTEAAGKWSFDGQTISYGSASVPQVPVPAAIWLMGSGLIGLVGVARRKTISA